MVRFCFMDPVNGFIEFDLVKTFQDGWTIVPIRKPQRVSERKYTVLQLYNSHSYNNSVGVCINAYFPCRSRRKMLICLVQ